MPCVRNISISHALSYFDDDIKKKEEKGFDYYSQEDNGVWFGKTAEKLGLSEKPFTRDDFHNMMKGNFYYINENGEKVNIDMAKHSGHKMHHSGIEITLSAPKSFSVMAEVFKDKRILDSHIMAVNSTIEYIEKNYCYTRSFNNGNMYIEKVDNLLAAKFTHHTNRNQDPQLHTHILIQNIIIDKNNKIKTAEHSSIFENERFIREIYNGELSAILQNLGYKIEWDKKINQIVPEIKGIHKEFNEIFSSRRMEIEKYAKENGISLEDSRAMEYITLKTRKAKDKSVGLDEMSPIWENKVKELNIDIDEFKSKIYQENLESQKNLLNTKENNSLSKILENSLNHLTERKATFTKEEIISSVIKRSNGLYYLKEIEKEIENNLEIVKADIGINEYSKHLKKYKDKEKIIYTTNSQINLENTIKNNLEQGEKKFKVIFSEVEIEKIDKKRNLSEFLFGDNKDSNSFYSKLNKNQKNTVKFILNNKDQFVGIQGFAGVGKTYTIKALNEKLKEKGYTLLGFAPTNSAAQTLKDEANIKADTLQSFLAKYNGYANDRDGNIEVLKNLKNDFNNKIILIDEASLVSNKQMKELTNIANKLNFKVIFQGDEKQLDSVEAGTPFQRMIKENLIKYSKLDNILRQNNEILKNAVYDIIKKDIEKSFEKLEKNKNIIELRTDKQLNLKTNENYLKDSNLEEIKKDLINKSVEKYLSYNLEDREKCLIVTSSNEIRKEINEKIRDNLIINNKNKTSITIETIEIKSLTNQEKKEINSYEKGNIIVFNKNNEKLNIKKGQEYFVKDVEFDKNNKDSILISNEKEDIVLNVKKISNTTNVYNQINKSIILNDKLKWTITDKNNEILKGDDLKVKEININKNERNETIKKEEEKDHIVLFNNRTKKDHIYYINEDKNILKHIDYNYVSTSYSAQGKTSKNVILTLESYRPNLTSQKDFYVGLSRVKDDITIITDNKNASIQSLIKNTGEKLNATEISIGAKQKINEIPIILKNKDIDFDK